MHNVKPVALTRRNFLAGAAAGFVGLAASDVSVYKS